MWTGLIPDALKRRTRPRLAAVGLGLAIVGGLTAADIATPPSPLSGTFVLGPFVVSLLAGGLETALVGPVAVALALISSVWNHNFGTAPYVLDAAIVLVGSVVAVIAARSRTRVLRDRARFALLVAVADVGDGRLSLEETAQQVCTLLVPDLADLCIVDVFRDDALRRLAVKAWGRDARQREEQLMARWPSTPEAPGSGAAVATGEAQLLRTVPDELNRQAAHDDADLELLRSLRQRSLMVVPLRARGHVLGAVSLSVTEASGRAYRCEDLAFCRVLAGRVALALDNAGLFTELESTESQLSTALGSLTEGVTVQNPSGALVYANEAAARLLGFSSVAEMLAVPPAAAIDRFDLFHEDGSPLNLAELPRRQLVTGTEAEPLVIRMVDRGSGQQSWKLTKAAAMRDPEGRLTMVVNVISDITATKRAELTQRLLAQAGDVFSSSMRLSDTLQQLADLCVPDLADWCVVSIPDERDQLRAAAVAHSDPRKVQFARETAERYPPSADLPTGEDQVLHDGATLVQADVTDETLVAVAQDEQHLEAMRSLALRSLVMVPITNGSQTVGVLTLISAESGRRFSEEDIALAEELARRAGVAFENARLYMERSNIARTLQTSLLPEQLPAIPGWRTATLFQPAGDESYVGGDFYQAVRLTDGWLLMVGDVTGRGAPAAALTAFMRHTLRTAARMSGSVTTALSELNLDLLGRPQLSLCTAVCVTLPDAGGSAEIICAGHPLPVLIRHGQAHEVGANGPLLGAFPDVRWTPVRVEARPGDVLVLYSDGVIDAVGPAGRFGQERLRQTLTATSGAADAVQRVNQAVSQFQVGEQSDDIAVLAIESTGKGAGSDSVT